MVNKKGFIKTLEAIVAIIILIVFISVFIRRDEIIKKDDEKSIVASSLLSEIQDNDILRGCVLIKDKNCIDNYLNESITNRYYYNFSICDLGGSCLVPSLPKTDVYVKSIVVSSNLTTKESRIIRVYLWNRF